MRQLRLLIFAALIFLCLPVMAGETGKVGGIVTNEFGDPLMGAQVVILHEAIATTVLHPGGGYELSHVPVGQYSILYTSQGFDSLLITDVPVGADSTTLVNIELSWEPGNQQLYEISFFGEPADADSAASDSLDRR